MNVGTAARTPLTPEAPMPTLLGLMTRARKQRFFYYAYATRYTR
jgi:hypothetical protein